MTTQLYAFILLCGLSLLFAQQPDNTKKNKRDRTESAVTADQQSEKDADRELTRKIRAALTSNKQLSTYAKNIKVISKDGKVTLRGPVNTDAEKKEIETVAANIAGTENVTSEIEIVK